MIRLAVLDVDGVLTEGEGRPLDLALLADLADLNRRARADPARPAVTLCTGRPAPYVEVLVQAIDGHLPAIFENGCGLYLPSAYRFLAHPELADGNRGFVRARERLRAALVETGRVFFQPGKEYSLSLFPLAGVTVADLRDLAEAALGDERDSVELLYSPSCLNVVPRGLDKGAGLDFLCQQAGYRLDEVLAVGDSDVDLPFLTRSGHAAAPANANAAVKRLVEYVSPYRTSAGVRDVLRHFGILP